MIDVPRLTSASFLAAVEHHAELGSTQDRARQLAADAAAKLPLLIVADRQTAGRGREGNSWWTGVGGLAFSLLFDPQAFGCPRRPAPRLSLAVGVALIAAPAPRLVSLASPKSRIPSPEPLGLHWPNDVFIAERKLAGILVEVLPDGRHIIGVGLNTNNRAADARPGLRSQVATLLDLTGRPHDHTDVLIDLLAALETRLRQLGADDPLLGAAFDDLCLQHDQPLTVYLGDQSVSGRCVGIAPDGGLILDTPSGRRAFHSGTLRPPVTMQADRS